MKQSEAGKGSAPRKKQDYDAYSTGWDKIFKKEKVMEQPSTHNKFKIGDNVKKIKGSEWKGKVVGWYSTELTKEGYAVESSTEKGSVQIYPVAALELWDSLSS